MPRFARTVTTVLLASLLLPSSAFASDDIADQAQAKVEKIESGDVLVVKLADSSQRVKVRVLGIDCTQSAKGAASALVARTTISLRSDKPFLPILQDQHGRYVAYVETSDGRDFGLEMIKSGKCTTEDWQLPHPKRNEYASASR